MTHSMGCAGVGDGLLQLAGSGAGNPALSEISPLGTVALVQV